MTKVTDGSGFATFEHLIPGVYKIEEQVEPGWEAVDDVDSQTQILRDCETKDVVFKNREIVGDLRIYGHKYLEAWEFPYQSGKVGLSGWVITATLKGTDTEIAVKTDALGAYEFTAKALKDAGIGFAGAGIEVCEEKRDNWDHVTPRCVLVKFPYPAPADYKGAKVDFVNVEEKLHSSMKDKDHPDGPAPDDGCGIKHTVARGETVARIGSKYGASVATISKANGLKNANLIRTGQVLCIPGDPPLPDGPSGPPRP
jgi:hypothetical protein